MRATQTKQRKDQPMKKTTDLTKIKDVKKELFYLNYFNHVMQYENRSDFFINQALNEPKVEKNNQNVYIIG